MIDTGQAEARFITGNEERVDRLNRAHFSLWTSNYWLTNRVRLIGSGVCLLVAIYVVASVRIVYRNTASCTAKLTIKSVHHIFSLRGEYYITIFLYVYMSSHELRSREKTSSRYSRAASSVRWEPRGEVWNVVHDSWDEFSMDVECFFFSFV